MMNILEQIEFDLLTVEYLKRIDAKVNSINILKARELFQ